MSLAQQISGFNVWIGGVNAAKDRQFLQQQGIVGILDVGSTNRRYFPGIRYSKFDVGDNLEAPIELFFDPGADFIDLVRPDGAVLVHCQAGLSRSATIVAAWLIRKFNMPADAALELIRKFRPEIRPNSGFYSKLKEYHNKNK